MILLDNEAKSIEFNLNLSNFESALVDTFREHQPQPIRAVEKTLKNLLFNEVIRECKRYNNFICASITIHESYNNINRSLAYLSENGLTLWYSVIETKWKKPYSFNRIICNVIGIELIPLQIGQGYKYYQNDYYYERKTQVNLKTQLNEIKIAPDVFSRILAATKEEQDFLIYTGSEYLENLHFSFNLPHYYRNYDNKLFICSCTKNAFEKIPSYHSKLTPEFKDNVCHICKSTSLDRNALIELYGVEYLTNNAPFVEKFVADGIPHRTALAEFSRIFKTSKWKNEAELYAIIKVLFPSFSIIREYNPKELQGLRIDIFIQELNLAIEYQGQQHFQPVKAFDGEDSFKKLQERDALKKRLCKELGIELRYFTYKEKISLEVVSNKLKKFLPNQSTIIK